MKHPPLPRLLVALLLALTAIAASAYDFEVDGIYYSYNYDGTSVRVTYEGYYDDGYYYDYYNSCSGSVTIPSQVTYRGITYSVTEIDRYAFQGSTGLTSVTIPNSVTEIGHNAFENCSGLTSVTIGNSVTEIDSKAFKNCTGLTSVTIPNSITSIWNDAFVGCSGLIKSAYPEHLSNPFSDGVAVSYPSDGVIQEDGTIYNADKTKLYFVPLTVTVFSFPNTVTSIGASAFRSCSCLTSVTIPNSVTAIGNYAFEDCSGLVKSAYPNHLRNPFDKGEAIAYPYDGIIEADGAIYNADKTKLYFVPLTVTDFSFPNTVTSIGNYAFYGCSGLTSVSIPNFITEIRWHAFYDCSGLKKAAYPDHLSNPFESNVAAIAYPSDGVIQDDGTIFSSDLTKLYYVPNNLLSIRIPKSVTSIGANAFAYCKGLKSVVFGAGLTSIDSGAFSECRIKKAFWLPNTPPSGSSDVSATVHYVANDQYSFSNQTKYQFLSSMFTVDGTVYVPISPSERTCDVVDCTYSPDDKDITIAETVTNKGVSMTVVTVKPYSHIGNPYIESASISHNGSIGNYTFQNCTALQSAAVSNVGSVGEYAFDGCTNLQELTLTNEGNVANYAFYNTGSIANLTIANKGNLWPYAFKDSKLQNVIITNEGFVGECAFSGCTALQTATISNQGNIDNNAFQNCTALQLATISNQGNIGNSAFSGCTALQTASISNNGAVGASAFSGCSSLATATLGEEVTGIGEKAFNNCSALGEVVIPDAVTSIGASAFEGCVALENVSIGKGVTYLPQRVFYGCSSLPSLTIPNNVALVADYAFSGCTALSDLTIEDAEETEPSEDEPQDERQELSFDDWTSTNHDNSSTSYQEYSFTAAVGDVLTFNYSVSSEFGYDSLIIKLNGTQIVKESGTKSGSYRKEFTEAGSVTLYLSYTKDSSNSSGSDQATVTDIRVNDLLQTADSSALTLASNGSSPLFADCPLDEVYIGRKLRYYTASDAGYSPFYRNTSLRAVEITDAETKIYDNEFYGCTNLQTLKIGNGVKTIGKWAFSGCSSMEYFSAGYEVESIGQEAFSDCTGLTSYYSYSMVPPTCGDQALDDINKWE
ncbi:MAG: leucine-rich repeat protein, partial [Muribaculaceae bacterium]